MFIYVIVKLENTLKNIYFKKVGIVYQLLFIVF